MALRVYNTLTRQKEPFETVVPGQVGMYVCGPTVYRPSHLGHMVGPVIFDTVKRYLTYLGYQVTFVVNITDVDDKLIVEAPKQGISVSELAERVTKDYVANLQKLNVTGIDLMPRATHHIGDIIDIINGLIAKGYAYPAAGDVYFDVTKDDDYGKLCNRDPEQLEAGARIEVSERKRSPGDFALWKSAKPGEPAWDSPWGKGRPGWHIECSAMSRALLGETFDIHGGGLDLVFPHHENELAQSECCHGKPMVKYWLHNGLLRKGEAAGKIGGRTDRESAGGKMSRSAGAGGLADVIASQGGERIRFFLLKTHYRSTVLYDEEGLSESATALQAFYRFFERFQKITKQRFFNLPAAVTREKGEFDPAGDALLGAVHKLRASFLEKMDDDFNTGGAMADLFDLVRELNK